MGLYYETSCVSYTGQWLYSDCVGTTNHEGLKSTASILNKAAYVPILGSLAGISRVGLSIIHILGHLLAAAVTWDKGHLFHALKGGAELLRGLIETIPLGGYAMLFYDSPGWDAPSWYSSVDSHSCFLVKIVNPNDSDYEIKSKEPMRGWKHRNPIKT